MKCFREFSGIWRVIQSSTWLSIISLEIPQLFLTLLLCLPLLPFYLLVSHIRRLSVRCIYSFIFPPLLRLSLPPPTVRNVTLWRFLLSPRFRICGENRTSYMSRITHHLRRISRTACP